MEKSKICFRSFTIRGDRDRIRAVGMDPDDYQIQKQADTLMAYYNLGPDEVKRVVTDDGV